MRCRGDVGHPEVGLRMSTGPHPPPAIYSPGSMVPEPSRRGGGQGNHIDRTRLHKRLVVLTSRITEETRASSPNNGGHLFCFNNLKREPGALRSLTSKLCARWFLLRSSSFRLGFIKPKTIFLRNPFLRNFRRPKKEQKICDTSMVYACVFSHRLPFSDQTWQEQNFILRCFDRAFFQRSTTL
jgi:hypothetical protein